MADEILEVFKRRLEVDLNEQNVEVYSMITFNVPEGMRAIVVGLDGLLFFSKFTNYVTAVCNYEIQNYYLEIWMHLNF